MSSKGNDAPVEYKGDTKDQLPLNWNPIKRRLQEKGVVQREKKNRTDGLKLMTGGFNLSDSEEDDSNDSSLLKICPEKLEYLREAKRQLLNTVTADKYFTNKKLIYNFGIATAVKCRLGFCEQTGVWRIVLMKPNTGVKPSIISIAYAEVDELIEKLELILKKIEQGIENGDPYLKPPPEELGPEWRAERSDNIQFWQKDVFYLSSGRLRLRVQWMFGDFYAIFLNNPSDNSMYEKFFGPKIRLGCRECQQLIKILREIVSRCPTYSQMVEFLDSE